MQLDRALGKTKDGRVVEIADLECQYQIAGKGAIFTDADAERLGITAYYERQRRAERQRVLAEAKAAHTEPSVKAVQQSEVEDKAVAGPGEHKAEEPTEEVPPSGVISPPEPRRLGGRRG